MAVARMLGHEIGSGAICTAMKNAIPAALKLAKPGTEEKVLMLSARYAAGLPLWHDRDCYDHGPKERELMGAISDAHPQPLPIPETDDEV